ncbi:SPARC-related modular calcium-binding protein 1-like isoform X2 [Acanthaster planci]|uniref:SPARC-related modular calcium-binding protein 1-like isoform X2 n=1 Tax=Acanthaster planci TaxID=133434 RepID=A0A8B7YCJ5_ACAPL|nr:SPARC-related modular calcium-binding protein 1-like isoform X2 [Acanthaster planci]
MTAARPILALLAQVLLITCVQPSLASRFPLAHELTSRERDCEIDCSTAKARPVCGMDGQTYNSRCEIRVARCLGNSVQIKHKGQCEGLTKCQTEQAASRMRAMTSTEGVFVPQCEEDGSFSKVQCHQSFGYCWCVTEDGKPIPGSSVEQATKMTSPRPSCNGEMAGQTATFPPTKRPHPDTKGCSQDARIEFNTNLKDIFREEFHRLPTTQPSETTGGVQRTEDSQKRIIEWKFTELDSNGDMELDRKELNSLRRMMKKILKPKKCAKTFVEHCDLDRDERIAKTEWSFCLVDNNEQAEEEPTADTNLPEGLPPPVRILPVTPPPPGDTGNADSPTVVSCEAERERATKRAELLPKSGVFIPQCHEDGGYKAVQCHEEAGYCWCVYVDTGRPIPGTSTSASTPEFNCDENATSRGPAGIRVFEDCSGNKKEEFFEILLDIFTEEMSIDDSIIDGASPERVARWKFQQLDESGNNLLERREYLEFKEELKKINAASKKCRRNFIEYCDEDGNKDLSMGEWLTCLEVRTGNPSQLPSGPNPFIDRLM